MSGKPHASTVPELSRVEKARRNACKDQAGRIRAYMPKLRAQEEALETELGEVRKLIADELRAYDELMAEAEATPEAAA